MRFRRIRTTGSMMRTWVCRVNTAVVGKTMSMLYCMRRTSMMADIRAVDRWTGEEEMREVEAGRKSMRRRTMLVERMTAIMHLAIPFMMFWLRVMKHGGVASGGRISFPAADYTR